MYGPFGPGYYEPMWWLGALVQLAFLLILVVAAVLVARWFLRSWQPGRHGAVHPRALEELDLRYARGEIDRTEYLQRRADLLGGTPPPGGPPPPPPPPRP